MPEKQDSSSKEDTLTLDSDLGELERLRAFVESFCDRTTLSEQVRDHLSVVLEELVANAIMHGRCNPRVAAIRIDLQVQDGRLQVVFSDNGVPFNPLAMPPPDLGENVGGRPIGDMNHCGVVYTMPAYRAKSIGRHCSMQVLRSAELLGSWRRA